MNALDNPYWLDGRAARDLQLLLERAVELEERGQSTTLAHARARDLMNWMEAARRRAAGITAKVPRRAG